MFLNKNIGKLNIVLRTDRFVNFTLFNLSLDRFYGTVFNLTILNVSLMIRYVSEKQEKAWQSLMKDVHNRED